MEQNGEKTEPSKEMLQKKLSAHDIWVKVNHEKLSDKDHKKLLFANGIIVPKQKELSCAICGFYCNNYHHSDSFYEK